MLYLWGNQGPVQCYVAGHRTARIHPCCITTGANTYPECLYRVAHGCSWTADMSGALDTGQYPNAAYLRWSKNRHPAHQPPNVVKTSRLSRIPVDNVPGSRWKKGGEGQSKNQAGVAWQYMRCGEHVAVLFEVHEWLERVKLNGCCRKPVQACRAHEKKVGLSNHDCRTRSV